MRNIYKIFLFIILLFPSKSIYAQFDLKEFAVSKLGVNKNIVSGAEIGVGLYQMNSSTVNYKNNLSQITQINFTTKDPEELIRFYQSKMDDINREAERQKEIKKKEIAATTDAIWKEFESLLKQANVSTGNAMADMLISAGGKAIAKATAEANAKKKIEEEKKKAEEELNRYLQTTMSKIKFEILSDNQKARDEYLKASADCFYESDEVRFLENLKYLDCVKEQINANYTWQNANWIRTSCISPSTTTGFTSFKKENSSYIDAAKRKYRIFKESYPDQAFLESAKKYTEAALAEDKKNAEAYAFLAFMTEDVLDKYFYLYIASYLAPGNQSLVAEKKIIKFYFTDSFFNAITRNDVDFISRAVNYKFHLDIVDKNNCSPIAAAINIDQSDVLDILIKDVTADNLKDCYFYAIQKNAVNSMTKLTAKEPALKIIKKTTEGVPLLFIAAACNSNDAARFLLNENADFLYSLNYSLANEKPNEHKIIAGYIAEKAIESDNEEMAITVIKFIPDIYNHKLKNNNTCFENCVAKNAKNVFEVFTMKGADVAILTEQGNSLLEVAISNKANDIIPLLLDKNVNISAKPSSGGNFINLAINSGNGAIIGDLIKRGLTVNETDNSGKTPLYIAVFQNDLNNSKLLLSNGASTDIPVSEGSLLHIACNKYNTDLVNLLLEYKAPLNKTNNKGNTPIMEAAINNQLDIAYLILNSKPDVNIPNKKKWTPLHLAAWKGYKDFAQKLLASGANPNIKGEFGWTPLHYASRENNLDMARLLLQSKADKTIKDDWKRKPIKISRERRFKEMKKLLISGM